MTERRPHPLDGVESFARLARVLTHFGVVDGTESLLEESVQPETCMRQARTSLHFMGFGARKWRQEPWFRVHIERLHRRDGEVKFLVGRDSDPEGQKALKDLMEAYPRTFEARTMNERSLFRIVIIDKHRMLMAHYGHEVIMEDGQNAMGWQSPQLVVEQGTEWSLIIPFMMYYNEVWSRASPFE
jgi:hypothetical protein